MDIPRKCAGVIVFNSVGQTILVHSAKKHTPSFPKGKREKNETNLQAAFRELQEETGITEDNINLLHHDDQDKLHFIYEPFEDDPFNMIYFIGTLITTIDQTALEFDESEIHQAAWYSPNEVYAMVKQSRKIVFTQALSINNLYSYII